MSDNWVETETLKHELHIARDALEWAERERDEARAKYEQSIRVLDHTIKQADAEFSKIAQQRDKLYRAVQTVLDEETVNMIDPSPAMRDLREAWERVYDAIPPEYRRTVIYPEDDEALAGLPELP